jgi:micrococcal nuclease
MARTHWSRCVVAEASAPARSSSGSERHRRGASSLGALACLTIVVLGITACGGGSAATTATTLPHGANATVVRVVDGDTIIADIGGTATRIRLIGMDTPETVDPRKPVQCYGPQASHHTKSLLPPGTPVRLVRDEEAHDVYGRTLAYVYRAADNLFVDRELLVDGYARTLTIPPNDAHEGDLAAAQHTAEVAGKGLWSACPHQ